ncbi:MAG TPA: RIP metalloprotease [Acidimicrobiales bacterium]|jgi:membrane-associated protease RseP (regulator of RpoE activity)
MTGVLAPPAPAVDDGTPGPQPRSETVMRLAALVVGTAIVVTLLGTLAGWSWVIVAGSVIAIIMLHELGHFVTAKRSGMKATEFFVGFGPRLWSIKHGETEYGIKALPLGGYVKILGMTSAEELDPTDEPRSFVNQSTSKRVLVASAGSIVHLLLALGLAVGALLFIGNPSTAKISVKALENYGHGVLSPAQLAGIRPGDTFVSINGVPATSDRVLTVINRSGGKAIPVVVIRHGHRLTLIATPEPKTKGDTNAYLGVFLREAPVYAHPGLLGSITGGTALVWKVTTGTVAAFGHAFSPQGLGALAQQVGNPAAAAKAKASGQSTVSAIGAGQLLDDAAKAGWLQFIEILIALNISLGVLNMLPMLPLDGGHVAIALYERARTRKGKARYRADVNKLMPVVYAFMAFLLLFVASKMYLDIAHGVSNPFN